MAKKVQSYTSDSLLSVGMDYRGQAQMSSRWKGWGGGAQVGFELAFASATVDLAGSVAAGTVLVAQRGPAIDRGYPLTLALMSGRRGEVSAAAAASVGVNFSASVEVLGSPSGKLTTQAEAKHTFTAEEDEENKLEAVALGASFTAFAGAQAAAGVTWDWYQATDPCPWNFADQARLRETATTLLAMQAESKEPYKHGVKKLAWLFARKQGFARDFETGLIFKGHVAGKELIEFLTGVAARSSDPAIVGEATTHIVHLEALRRGESSEGPAAARNPTSLRVAAMKTDASAAIGASVTASAHAFEAVGVSVGASATAAEVQYTGKRATIRHETGWSGPDGGVALVTTQDTVISYNKVDFEFGKVAVATSASLRSNSSASREASLRGVSHQSMTYVSASLTWKRGGDGQAVSQPGSGLVRGQSCVVAALASAARDPVRNDLYLDNLARAIAVEPALLRSFLGQPHVLGLLQDLDAQRETAAQLVQATATPQQRRAARKKYYDELPESPVVLLEASFRAPDGAQFVCTGAGVDPALLKSMQARMPALTLESLRLRWRIQHADDGSRGFRLGFKFGVLSAGVSLRRVDEASTEGIVDLATDWIEAGKLVQVADADLARRYETAVPSVALFCQ